MRYNLLTNIAIVQTVTGHDVKIVGDFQYYLVANLRNNLSAASVPTFFSLTPGFRTHLGGEYFLAGGVEFPLTHPQPYGDRLIIFLVKTQLAKFRGRQPFEPPTSISQNTTFRELWSDGLATVATVMLFSILVFEILRLLIP